MQRRRAASNFLLLFFFSTDGRRKGKIAICLTLLSFSRFYLSTLVDRAKSKERSETVFFRIFPRWNYFARSLDDDVALIFSSQLGPSIPTKVLLYIVYSILNTEYAYTAILRTDKSIHLYIRD